MPDLRRAFEAAGFTDVATILGSGNVAFNARAAPEATLERKAEAAMKSALGKSFYTIIRSAESLRALLDANPYAKFDLPPDAKRVVTFSREPLAARVKLPVTVDGASVLAIRGKEALSAYVRGAKGPVFMVLIEKTFGTEVTTRTWETVGKCAKA
jgi:uncharacterized protein (DUF1697 family)